MIFFVRFSSSTAFSIWQPKNAQQTLGDKRVCILKLATLRDRIMTDQAAVYPYALAPEFSDRHETVNHIIGEYVRGDVYTNSIESAFSLLERAIIGSFHKVSGKHLHRYCSEFEYRYNARKDADRFTKTLARMAATPIMPYRELIVERD